MLTAEIIKQKACEYGADLVGIGDIAGFDGVDKQRDPLQILPDATAVIGFGFAVPRSLYMTMERGYQFHNYTQMGVKVIDEELAEVFLLRMAGLIEDEGYDACVQRNISNLKIKGDHSTNAELYDTYELALAEAISPEKAVPDVIIDFGLAAEVCGLGARSIKGNVLCPVYGPFVRFVYIITDLPLQTDRPFTGNLCDKCGECLKACPGHAISNDGLDTWQCAVYYRGAHKSNPLMTEDFLQGDPRREAILNGDYHFTREAAREIYPKIDFLPYKATGYVGCLCGKKCDMACYKHLKEKNLL